MTKVCILTSGRGTRMGELALSINKGLLPFKKKAIISNIIDAFPPDTEFVISVGFLGEQVKDYLQCAYPEGRFTFAEVKNFEGPGSGPGLSLLQCRPYLNEPFFFVSCDTVWEGEIQLDSETSWAGVVPANLQDSAEYCNFAAEGSDVVKIIDKEAVSGANYFSFSGLLYVADHEIFWAALEGKNLIKNEHQISNGLSALVQNKKLSIKKIHWLDLGDYRKYREALSKTENFDFSKSDEFIYFINNSVIKYFKDGRITEKRVAKAALNPEIFPKIAKRQGNFYSYKLVPGKTLYHVCNPDIFKDLLTWLDTSVWKNVDVSKDVFAEACENFYVKKTRERIQMYLDKYKTKDTPSVVNGKSIPAIDDLMEKIPWKNVVQGVPKFFHGDLQFDNILYDESKKKFTLIDWRQDFGGHVAFGDQYYDLAKLYGGLHLNYDLVKLNLFQYFEKGPDIFLDFAQRKSFGAFSDILSNFAKSKQLSFTKVQLLTSLIYLNMSPLHHYPFDKMLWSLGKSMLYDSLKAE